jgi:nitrite reductase (cytochrome c-552)
MVARGYETDKEQGIKATRTEMRNFVCNQCHVEYYFQGDNKLLTFPWNDWPKDKPFRIEMLDTYYDKARNDKVFLQDFLQKGTQTPIIKIQHPETELYSSGIHARSGVTCADCHMPYKRDGGEKVSNHALKSPLENINQSCKSCHAQSETEIAGRVKNIQMSTANSLRESERALVALITDIKTVRIAMVKLPKYAAIADDAERDKAISKELEPVLMAHRKSQMRWDFIFSENSTGFHSPQEATRVLAQSMDMARGAQAELVSIAAKNGIIITPTKEPVMPKAPAPIPNKDPKSKVGIAPPAILFQVDKESIAF